MGILCIWLVCWYRTTDPSPQALGNAVSTKRKIALWAAFITGAVGGAAIRVVVVSGIPTYYHFAPKRFAGQFVITMIALIWWELVAYGVFSSKAAADGEAKEYAGGKRRDHPPVGRN